MASGFTLLELLTVITIIAILASIAIPMIKSARLRANEAAALATLRNLATQQAQVRTLGVIDANHNGRGEYAYFQELSGYRKLKSGNPASGEGPATLRPPVLSSAFGKVDINGRVLHSGYLMQLYLPGAGGTWLAERWPGQPYPPVAADWAEYHWACYAWPGSFDRSGSAAFFISNVGELLETVNRTTRYSGTASIPAPTAALLASAANRTSMNHSIAVNATGVDGNYWRLKN